MSSAITLVDLDDTLFQTLRKCPVGTGPERLVPYAFGMDGEAISYATPAQAKLITWLEETSIVVAVTGRSSGALRRSNIKFRHAIASHGGIILDNAAGPFERRGEISSEWSQLIRDRLSASTPIFSDLVASVERDAVRLGVSVRVRQVCECRQPMYVVAKLKAADGDERSLHEACEHTAQSLPPGWITHMNGNNVAFLPPYLGKAHAIEWLLPQLRERYPDVCVIGIGDSVSDAPFMEMCDFAATPAGSQLASRLFGGGNA